MWDSWFSHLTKCVSQFLLRESTWILTTLLARMDSRQNFVWYGMVCSLIWSPKPMIFWEILLFSIDVVSLSVPWWLIAHFVRAGVVLVSVTGMQVFRKFCPKFLYFRKCCSNKRIGKYTFPGNFQAFQEILAMVTCISVVSMSIFMKQLSWSKC